MVESVEVLIHQPGHPDRVVTLREGASRLGRAEDNEVVLSDVGVSRRHAQVYVGGGEVTIEDLGSGNGTYYSGYRIQSQPLQHDDEVVIDPFVLTFKIRGEQAANMPIHKSAGNARLEVIVGTGMAGSSYAIGPQGLSIGRSEDRDVVIPDPAASRHHCSVLQSEGAYVLRDMGSANGIFVNAVRVRDCTLEDGDLIRIGNTEMRFVLFAQGASSNAPQSAPEHTWDKPPTWSTPPARGVVPRTPIPTQISAPRNKGGIVAVFLTGVFALGAVIAVIGVLAVIAVLYFSQPDPIPNLVSRPLSWSLDLPAGQADMPISDLFDKGVEKYGEGKNAEALEYFYRALSADPANESAEKFSFATGEVLVLDALSAHKETVVQARKARETNRDQMLRDVRRSGRTGRAARAALEKSFRDDPVVIEAMGWKKRPEILALEATLAEAADLSASESYAEAIERYRTVFDDAPEPTLRKTSAAGLRLCERELARTVAVSWNEAVLLEATGKNNAKAKFEEVLSQHPTNPSARLHVQRLQR